MLVICGGGLTLCILWMWTIMCGMSLRRARAYGSSAFMEAWRQTTHTSQRNKQRQLLFSARGFHFRLATFVFFLIAHAEKFMISKLSMFSKLMSFWTLHQFHLMNEYLSIYHAYIYIFKSPQNLRCFCAHGLNPSLTDESRRFSYSAHIHNSIQWWSKVWYRIYRIQTLYLFRFICRCMH